MRRAPAALPIAVLSVLLAGPARAQAPDSTVAMPAELVAGRFFVAPVTAAGDTLRFYTDTGGGLFVHADAVADHGLAVDTLGMGGDTLLVARLPELDERAWIPPPTSAWGPGLPVTGRGAGRHSMDVEDGILGQAWFAGRTWTLDYPAGRLLLRPEGAPPPAGAASAPLAFRTDSLGNPRIAFPRIRASVDGDTLDFLLDTGATVDLTPGGLAELGDGGPRLRATSFVTTEVFDRWRTAHPDWRVIERADRTVDSMGMIEVPEVEIAGRTVGPVWFTRRPDRAFHEFMAQWMDRPVDGALGGNALGFFRVTVDYPGATAYFEPPREPVLLWNPDWSPDGASILYESSQDGDGVLDLWVVGADGSTPRRLRENAQQGVWSPDGSRILFVSDDDGDLEVYVMDADGSGATRLTDNDGADYGETWFPDGERIAWVSRETAGGTVHHLWLARADGSGARRVTDAPPSAYSPDVAPDGERIALIRGDWPELALWTMDADGSDAREIFPNAIVPEWSPDGSRIAFTSRVDGDLEIFTVAPDGTDAVRLTDREGIDNMPSWSPDGERIVYVSVRPEGPRLEVVTKDGDPVGTVLAAPGP